MVVKKQLEFRTVASINSFEDDNDRALARDIWLATWGVVAVFVIVILVMFFTGNLPITGAGVTLVPAENACLRGNAVTSLALANEIISAGGVCEQGLLPNIRCCWWP